MPEGFPKKGPYLFASGFIFSYIEVSVNYASRVSKECLFASDYRLYGYKSGTTISGVRGGAKIVWQWKELIKLLVLSHTLGKVISVVVHGLTADKGHSNEREASPRPQLPHCLYLSGCSQITMIRLHPDVI